MPEDEEFEMLGTKEAEMEEILVEEDATEDDWLRKELQKAEKEDVEKEEPPWRRRRAEMKK